MTKPSDLTTVLPPQVSKIQCNCGQLILAGWGYYHPMTEKKIEICPNCGEELSMMTTRPVKEQESLRG